jgi:hypothetical protein
MGVRSAVNSVAGKMSLAVEQNVREHLGVSINTRAIPKSTSDWLVKRNVLS